MQYLLGIDVGTSGTKTVLFDVTGKAIADAVQEYPLYQPQNGWAEQDPADWWHAVCATTQTVLKCSGVDAKQIAGIGISGQMHGLVLLDADGTVLRRSILWCDGRTTQECAEFTQRVGAKRLIQIAANPALEGFTAGKILWVQKHEPEIWNQCAHVLLPKDYIRYCLTGLFATEVSDASGMNLLDVGKRCWSEELLEAASVSKSQVAQMYESCEVTGCVTEQAAMATGLAAGTVVVGGAGDNAAAAVGTGVVESGKAFATLGTSGVIFSHTDRVSIDAQGRVHTFCAAVPNAWTVMSCTLAAGLSLKWFRDQFCQSEVETAKGMGVDPYILMDQAAQRVPIGANRLLFLPYLMGERSPILDANSRGVFFGLSAIHTKYDLLRAVMEGVIYAQRSCLDILRNMQAAPEEMLACGGGGKSKIWRQMMADVFACPIRTLTNQEGPALGVALLAGVGAGIYKSVPDACHAVLTYQDMQSPNPESTQIYDQYYAVYQSLYPNLKECFSKLAVL